MVNHAFVRSLAAAIVVVLCSNPAASQSLSADCGYVDSGFAYDDCTASSNTSALGQAFQDIGTSQQNGAISRALSGQHSGGVLAIFPTGRVARSRHDGLESNLFGNSGRFDANEYSAFLNATYDVPGVVFGGQLKLAGLVGGLHLSVDQASFFSTHSENDSFFIGGSSVWSQGSFYSSSTFIYFTGITEATVSDNVGGSGQLGSDTEGFVSNSVAGYVFDVPSAGDNVKFDLRGVVGNAQADDDFREANDAAFNYASRSTELDVWHGTISGMLFAIVPASDGGFSRPFVQLSYKRLFEYDNEVDTVVTGPNGGRFIESFDQAKDYGRVDVGFDHVSGPYTFGTALYVEASEDERTVGGRLGVSYKFSSGE